MTTRWPSDERLDRAADLIEAIARIPDLHLGKAILPAETLDRVVRWEHADSAQWNPAQEVCVDVPFPDDDQALAAACMTNVYAAVTSRQGELDRWVKVHWETGDALAAERFAARMYSGETS